MDMTKKQLEDYRSKKAEILELQYKLDHLGEGDSLIGNDVIMDYRTGFPRPQSVVGYDYKKEDHLKEAWRKRLENLKKECVEVELWIEEIPDSLTRRIFRMYFTDDRRLSQSRIARKVHLAQSEVSKKISKFLKLE